MFCQAEEKAEEKVVEKAVAVEKVAAGETEVGVDLVVEVEHCVIPRLQPH